MQVCVLVSSVAGEGLLILEVSQSNLCPDTSYPYIDSS